MAYTVADYAFAPLTVAPGQEVEVVDSDAEAHTLTAIDGSFDRQLRQQLAGHVYRS